MHIFKMKNRNKEKDFSNVQGQIKPKVYFGNEVICNKSEEFHVLYKAKHLFSCHNEKFVQTLPNSMYYPSEKTAIIHI